LLCNWSNACWAATDGSNVQQNPLNRGHDAEQQRMNTKKTNTHASERARERAHNNNNNTLAVQESEAEKMQRKPRRERGDWGNRVPPFSSRWQLCLSIMDEPVCHSFLKGGNRILSIHPSTHSSIYLLLLLLWISLVLAQVMNQKI
jgi:hypothetical protein